MSGTTTLAPGAGNTITLTGTIADDSASALMNGTGSGAMIAVQGGGTVQLDGQSSIAGGFTVGSNSNLAVGSSGVIGAPGTAVQMVGSGSVFSNAGTVNGGDGAVRVSADGTIINETGGTISGVGTAILVDGTAHANIGLNAASTVNGDIVVAATASATVRLDGLLNGAFQGGDGSDALLIGATGTVNAISSLGGGDDLLVLVNGAAHAGIDGGTGSDALFLDGYLTTSTAGLGSITGFEGLGKVGAGTLTVDSVPAGFTQFFAGNGGDDDGILAFSNTAGLTGDIYVNGAILRADTAGAFGTATIHMIDPTVQFGASGTYANDILLEVAAPASSDPTRLEAINGSVATLTGAITTGTTATTDPTQYVTIGGNGTIVLTNASNSWLGTTTIEAGASLVGTSSSISGSNIVVDGLLTYDQASSGTVSQAISGAGSLNVTGLASDASLTFAESLTFTGTANVNNSSVIFAADNSIGSVTVTGNDGEIVVGADGSLVTSANYAVYGASGSSTVDNAGLIESTTFVGVRLDGASSNLVNREGGTISGYYTGSSNGASTVVDNSGVIQGWLFNGLDGGSLNVVNQATGQIIGNGQYATSYGAGIQTSGNLTLTNFGQVVGRHAGISAGGTLDLTNSGLIGSGSLSGTTFSYSDGNDGVQTYAGGTIDNQSEGQILGSVSGIYHAGGLLDVTNAGLIHGNSYGIYSEAGLILENLAGGEITGTDRAILAFGSATITNDEGALIEGANGAVHSLGTSTVSIFNAGDMLGGIYSTQGGDLAIVNEASGSIIREAFGSAIDLVNGGSLNLDNAGTIVGSGWGVVGRNSDDVIINSGLIASGTTDGETLTVSGNEAVSLLSGGTVTNTATGQIRGNSAGVLANGPLGLSNAGSIEGGVTGNTAGVWMTSGSATIDNLAGGTISGNGWGVAHASSDQLVLTNAGSITGNIYNAVYAGAADGNQITNLAGGTLIGGNAAIYSDGTGLIVNNAGLIQVVGGSDNSVVSAIYSSAAGASITNSGTIESTLATGNGIRLDQGGSITNLAGGVISGGADGFAIDLRGASVLDLQQGSTVNGTILVSGAGAVTTNIAGTVNGSYDASAGTGSDGLTLAAGGTVANALLGGGNDALTLNGSGLGGIASGGAGSDSLTFDIASGTTSYDAAKFVDFESRTKAGLGTLSLTGTDSLTADFAVNGGTLVLSGGSAINNAAAVILAGGTTLQLDSSEAIRTLSGSGSVTLGANVLALVGDDNSSFSGVMSGSGGLLKDGSGTLELLGQNTFTGGLLIAGGSVKLGASERLADGLLVEIDEGATFDLAGYTETIGGLVGDGSVTLDDGRLIVSSALNSQFDGVISGTGNLTKSGTGILLLTGANTYSGSTDVTGGLLLVNGSLASVVTVGNGGILGGNGTVGGLVVNSGGILAPGNSIGHLQVAGNLSFAAGSIYQVETTPTAADLVSATGNVTINGGTVQVLAGGINYSPITNYVIIQAGGTVTGTFNGVTSNLAFLDPTLSYSATQVRLTLRRNDIDFAEAARTDNQFAVAEGLEDLDSGAIFDALIVQSASGARQIFDALSGEIYASTPMAIADKNNRLVQAMRKADRRREGALYLWADASRSGANHVGRSGVGAATARDDDNMLLGGLGYAANGFTVSAGGGVANSDINVDARASKADVDSKLLGADVSYTGVGLEVGGGITHSWHDIDTTRFVGLPGIDGELTSSRDARITQVDLFAALPMSAYGVNVAPFAELSHQRIKLDATLEHGNEAALSIDAERFRSTRTLVGARMHKDISGWGGVITPRMSFGWEHLMGNRKGVMTASLDGSARFQIDGVARSADAARVSAGIDGAFGNVRIGIGYDARLAGGDDRQSVNLNLGISF
ncbi:hypothetical protein D3M59_10740 [Sphingomonas edaphi]|uniref:Autotransporter domain-containing protein n=2 Tax=Sphingomonas edaphi TaxID=2315689 RepID=A0A418PYG5_9SPHN|nr:hypothetical protein D3M59_10740 [Sphingomonas edaphi]